MTDSARHVRIANNPAKLETLSKSLLLVAVLTISSFLQGCGGDPFGSRGESRIRKPLVALKPDLTFHVTAQGKRKSTGGGTVIARGYNADPQHTVSVSLVLFRPGFSNVILGHQYPNPLSDQSFTANFDVECDKHRVLPSGSKLYVEAAQITTVKSNELDLGLLKCPK